MGSGKLGTDLKGLIQLAKEFGFHSDNTDPKLAFPERFLQLQMQNGLEGVKT